MSTKEKIIITWDLGATKCSAAVVGYEEKAQKFIKKKSCYLILHTFSSLPDLVLTIEEKLGLSHKDADAVCIGAAGVYNGANLSAQNSYPFDMPFASFAKAQKWPPFAIIHDYASIVCATFTNEVHALKINNNKNETYARRVAFGVGTGLGLKDGLLFSGGDFWLGSNEMGHIGVTCPLTAPKKFLEIHNQLIKNRTLSFENILSGNGLVMLHQFLYPNSDTKTPEEVGELICDNKADQTLELFAFYLGLFTGTVQLVFMPEGGIFITGGVIIRHLNVFEHQAFFSGIESSPAYLGERQSFALRVLNDPATPLIGAAYYAAKRLF